MPNLALAPLPTPPIRVAFAPHPPRFCDSVRGVVATYWAIFAAAANCANRFHRCCSGLPHSPSPIAGHSPANLACSRSTRVAKSTAQMLVHSSCAKQAWQPWRVCRHRATSLKKPFRFDHRHGVPKPPRGQQTWHTLGNGQHALPLQCPSAASAPRLPFPHAKALAKRGTNLGKTPPTQRRGLVIGD